MNRQIQSELYPRLVAVLIAAGLLLSGCGPWSSSSSVSEPGICLDSLGDVPATVTGIFVEPDDGYEPVLDEIEAARCTLDLNMYMLTDEPVFESLNAAVDRGVDVRVILEQHPFGMFGDQQEAFDRLQQMGAEVQWEPERFQFSHAKYLVVDGRVALIMNQNFTGSAFNSNREFGVITTRPDEVQHANEIFEADWAGEPTESIDGPLLVSPDNSRERLLTLIGDATESIDFYAELIRDEHVLQALEEAVSRGVRVRLIMNASLDEEDIESVMLLAQDGVEVRLMKAVYIHSKTMIIDGDAAVVGSINYSMTSLDRNREVAMRVDDPLLLIRISAVFERDWIRSEPVDP